MPDLSPSLTILLQLPHLDEEVEALVITTGNYLISLSQQLGLHFLRGLRSAFSRSVCPLSTNVCPKT